MCPGIPSPPPESRITGDCHACPTLTWMLEIWTPVLSFREKVSSLLNCLTSSQVKFDTRMYWAFCHWDKYLTAIIWGKGYFCSHFLCVQSVVGWLHYLEVWSLQNEQNGGGGRGRGRRKRLFILTADSSKEWGRGLKSTPLLSSVLLSPKASAASPDCMTCLVIISWTVSGSLTVKPQQGTREYPVSVAWMQASSFNSTKF